MLLKLALSGLQNRKRDYIILLSGLTISVIVFYMFQALANSSDFMANSSPVSAETLKIAFITGQVLTGIITFVYIFFCNSFLVSIRQKDYGMYLMLGVRKGKLKKLIFNEFFVLGFFSLIVGLIVGIVATLGFAQVLFKLIDVSAKGFNPISIQGMIITLIFYLIVFILSSTFNASKLGRKKIINLLKDQTIPERKVKSKGRLILSGIVGIILIGFGYYILINMTKAVVNFGPESILVAMLASIIGTYFIITPISALLISLLEKSEKIRNKKLNLYTFGQLKARISEYNRVLATLTILFALSIGAISVGFGFQKSLADSMDAIPYDVTIENPTKEQEELISKLNIKSEVSYSYKDYYNESGHKITFLNADEFDKNPALYTKYNQDGIAEIAKIDGKQLLIDEDKGEDDYDRDHWQLSDLALEGGYNRRVLTGAEFNKVKLPTKRTVAIQVNDFNKDMPIIKQINKIQSKREIALGYRYSKTDDYESSKAMFNGMFFMGVFVGFLFLVMLASILMFKVLSGTNADIRNYTVVDHLGFMSKVQKNAIRKEILILFIVPASLGTVHALVGLNMFKIFLGKVYDGVWLPILIFIVIYLIYFVITVYLYQKQIFSKENK